VFKQQVDAWVRSPAMDQRRRELAALPHGRGILISAGGTVLVSSLVVLLKASSCPFMTGWQLRELVLCPTAWDSVPLIGFTRHTYQVLREDLGCTLPVQVAFRSSAKELAPETLASLQRQFGPVLTLDLDSVPQPPHHKQCVGLKHAVLFCAAMTCVAHRQASGASLCLSVGL
jgi:hypothetical protein